MTYVVNGQEVDDASPRQPTVRDGDQRKAVGAEELSCLGRGRFGKVLLADGIAGRTGHLGDNRINRNSIQEEVSPPWRTIGGR